MSFAADGDFLKKGGEYSSSLKHRIIMLPEDRCVDIGIRKHLNKLLKHSLSSSVVDDPVSDESNPSFFHTPILKEKGNPSTRSG